jgi:alginate O-acetyltransferase complex protein AlgI
VSAYLPHEAAPAWLLAAVLALVLLLGFAITRIPSPRWGRLAAWLLVVSATAGAERLTAVEPAGFRMLAIIGVLLYAMKAVVGVESRADGGPRLAAGQWLAFAAGWFGMRPAPFARLGSPALPGAGPLVWFGVKRMLVGAAFLVLASLIWAHAAAWLSADGARLLATVPGLVGLSLILHFGVFNILAGLWRLAGVDCRQLFRSPLLSTSLGEFWGRRWNLAFSEMTAVGVYRPLAAVVGRRAATAAAFGCSGLLHELAISVPVLAGYGLPSLYFVLHGTLVLVERRLERAGRPINSMPWVGRLWVLAWLALPLPILFHPPFLRGVVWPLLGMDGSAGGTSWFVG